MTSLWIKCEPNHITSPGRIGWHHQISCPTDAPVETSSCLFVGVTFLSKSLSASRDRRTGRTTRAPPFSESSTSEPSRIRVSAANARGILTAKLFPQRWMAVFMELHCIAEHPVSRSWANEKAQARRAYGSRLKRECSSGVASRDHDSTRAWCPVGIPGAIGIGSDQSFGKQHKCDACHPGQRQDRRKTRKHQLGHGNVQPR
jgi:hypothetical protein